MHQHWRLTSAITLVLAALTGGAQAKAVPEAQPTGRITSYDQ
jgi:hypothetical protein